MEYTWLWTRRAISGRTISQKLWERSWKDKERILLRLKLVEVGKASLGKEVTKVSHQGRCLFFE
jgi:hypothetical protein